MCPRSAFADGVVSVCTRQRMDAARGRSAAELAAAATLSHYQTNAAQFWEGTRRHDVRQNREALLRAAGVGGSPDGAPSSAARVLDILDLGCGPGRDVAWFASKGHSVTALDGCSAFCGMCADKGAAEVVCADLHEVDLGVKRFDAVFANASLFHVQKTELPRVLAGVHRAIRPGGAFFASNPRAMGEEDVEQRGGDAAYGDGRYGHYMTAASWRRVCERTGFVLKEEYYRPPGVPREQQPWHATAWTRP